MNDHKYMQRCLTSLVIRKMEIATPYLLEWLKLRSLTIPKVGEDVDVSIGLSDTSGKCKTVQNFAKTI